MVPIRTGWSQSRSNRGSASRVLSVASSGLVSGTPTQAGTFQFTLVETDHQGVSWCGDNAASDANFTIKIEPGLRIVTNDIPQNASRVGQPYSAQLDAQAVTSLQPGCRDSCDRCDVVCGVGFWHRLALGPDRGERPHLRVADDRGRLQLPHPGKSERRQPRPDVLAQRPQASRRDAHETARDAASADRVGGWPPILGEADSLGLVQGRTPSRWPRARYRRASRSVPTGRFQAHRAPPARSARP